mgnify:FL=1
MCFFLAHALLPPFGCFACFCSLAPVVAPVVSPAAFYLLLVSELVHFLSLERLACFQSSARSARLSPRSVCPSVFPMFPWLLESIPSPVVELLRLLEPVLRPLLLTPLWCVSSQCLGQFFLSLLLLRGSHGNLLYEVLWFWLWPSHYNLYRLLYHRTISDQLFCPASLLCLFPRRLVCLLTIFRRIFYRVLLVDSASPLACG